MKLYYDPSSTTSRPVMLFAAEHGLDLQYEHIDLYAQAHLSDAYAAINPNRAVPVLIDGDLRLPESSAILKYLAEKVGSPAYPTDPKARARVNAAMDWFNTGFNRDFNYGVVYAQILPHHRKDEAARAQNGERSVTWFSILDEHMIGDSRFVCGDEITLADYLGACFVSVGELIGFDYSAYPNVQRWLETMKSRLSWHQVNAAFYGWRSAMLEEARRVA